MPKLLPGALILTVSTLAVVAVASATTTAKSGAMFVDAAPSGMAARQTLNDPTIVAIFDGANTADIETGDLAAKLGHSDEVKKFGAMLSGDHKMVRQQGRDLAKKLGVTPTPPKVDQGAIDHAAAMKKLSALKGDAFDHAFLQHEIAFHAAVIDAVTKTLLPAIQNAELKTLVQKVAPAFQGHMIAAQALDKKLFPKGGDQH